MKCNDTQNTTKGTSFPRVLFCSQFVNLLFLFSSSFVIQSFFVIHFDMYTVVAVLITMFACFSFRLNLPMKE